MNQDDHFKQHIDALKWQIAKLDGQSGVLINLRAGLSPIDQFAKRQFIENEIQLKIASIADLRGILNEMTGKDSGDVSESEI